MHDLPIFRSSKVIGQTNITGVSSSAWEAESSRCPTSVMVIMQMSKSPWQVIKFTGEYTETRSTPWASLSCKHRADMRSKANFTPTRKTRLKQVCPWTPVGIIIGINHPSLFGMKILSEWTVSEAFLFWSGFYSNYLCLLPVGDNCQLALCLVKRHRKQGTVLL